MIGTQKFEKTLEVIKVYKGLEHMLLDLPAIDSYISSAVKVVTKCLGEFWKSSGSNLTRTSAAPLSHSSTDFRPNFGRQRNFLRDESVSITQMRLSD